MKAQRNGQGVPGSPKGRKLRLLLIGRDCELKKNVARQIFSGDRLWITGRSATLLGALERLQSEAIDLVLLSHEFREAELALFVADARRDGFAGLVLRVVSAQTSGPGSFGDLPATDLSTKGQLAETLYSARADLGMPRQNEKSTLAIPLTARQRAVLTFVSRGWTSQRVARHLKCSEGSVKATLQQLFQKLGVRKRAQIVRVAFETNLIHIKKDPHLALIGRAALDHAIALPTERQSKEPIRVGDFVVDVSMCRVWVRGAEIHLTPGECELLALFTMHPGELVSGSSLRETFWRNPAAKHDSLRTLIRGLRAKIEVNRTPRYIVTERNAGYRFIASPSRSAAGQVDVTRSMIRVR